MNMHTKIPATLFCALFAMLALNACSGILNSGKPARQVYLLEPLAASSAPSANAGGPVLAVTVTAIPGLDTEHILSLGTDARLHQVANARWPDHQPEVLASISRRTLASTGMYSRVTEGPDAHGTNWNLELEIQEFFGIQDGGGNTSSVSIRLEGVIRCNGAEPVFTLADETSVSQQNLGAIVAAHQRVLNSAMRQLIDTLSDSCEGEI
jgi:ABC-type uncharacterized transport system auxiliary subunit